MKTQKQTQTKHTPGPWGLDDGEIYGKLSSDFHGTGMIARIPCEYRQGGIMTCEDEANAALIAAAPELLEALKEVYKWGERAKDERQQHGPVLRDYLMQAADTARAAIAKAEGGEG
jgi:hypothetical protein